MEILEEIPISIRNQQNLLNLLAEGYKSLSKALMEYIDNSFDSADDFFNSNDLYDRKVSIKVIVDRFRRAISIQDNCMGMSLDVLRGLANSINDSEKRRREQKRPWVNGQFGLGAHSFRFFAQKLIVVTKRKGDDQIAISIDRDSPNAQLILLDDKKLGLSGTLIEIVDIDKTHLKNLKLDDLRHEIETYFEMLLRRNVEVAVVEEELEVLATPFDYDGVDGISIKKEIVLWKRGSALLRVPEGTGIKVNLKVCDRKVDRPPFFSRKGRRINYIANMESFMRRTLHRKKVWENYYLTGYIEVGNRLEPVIARDDFLGGKGHSLDRSGIYDEIVKLEDEIHNAIEIINKDRSDESLKKLASVLTDFLSEIVKQEELKLRYENTEGKENKRPWIKVKPGPEGEKYRVGRRGEGKKYRGKTIKTAFPDENSNIFGKKIDGEKEGLRIEFNSIKTESNGPRAVYGDGVITVFSSHPDFVSRRGSNDLEQARITPRLSSYLAAVISSEYKEVFYRQKKLEPSRKNILDEQIDFIFSFEQKMKDLVNQPIDSIGQIIN